jgi:nucleotide-binding universal stress UspA family protein
MNAGTPRFRTLLVPVDGSPLSDKALSAAIAFALPLQAKVIALAVAEPYPECLTPMSENFHARSLAQARGHIGQAERLIREAGLACDGLAVTSYEPHREILDGAQRLGCDAIFIGMHGGDPLGRFFFGSQAQKVLAHSPVPVMVLR